MASNLACIGVRVDDVSDLRWLLGEVMQATTPTTASDGRSEYRWQDPAGSRLSFALEHGEIVDFTPSFAGETTVTLGTVLKNPGDIFLVDILASTGETVGRATVDTNDQAAFSALAESGQSAGASQLTALGVQVSVYENGDAFLSSDSSLLVPENRDVAGVPARWAAESFISFGSFNVEEPDATAKMHGTVLSAERRTVELTGESFIAARVRTSACEVDLCFPASADTPVPVVGNIVGGIVYLVATLADDRSFDPTPRLKARYREGFDRAARWLRLR